MKVKIEYGVNMFFNRESGDSFAGRYQSGEPKMGETRKEKTDGRRQAGVLNDVPQQFIEKT